GALAGLALGSVALLAFQQAGEPESLLPGDPAAEAPAAPAADDTAAPVEAAPSLGASGGETPTETTAAPSAFDLPAATGASIDVAGPLTPAMGGYGLAAFQGSDGVFVSGIVRRVRTPLASR